MGLRMRKSFKIAPGVRVNLGSKSAGVSFGTKGLRYSINTRGRHTLTVGVPGTGMSYSTSTTAKRRYKGEAYNNMQELKEKLRAQQIAEAQYEVEEYNSKIEVFKSIHKECDDYVDWKDILSMPEPFSKGEKGPREAKALNRLNSYKPNLIHRLFGVAAKQQESLQAAVATARQQDLDEYNDWEKLNSLAKAIIEGDTDAYLDVIKEMDPLGDLVEFGSGFEFIVDDPRRLEVEFEVMSESIIPKEQKTLTPTGKLSVREMTKTQYYDYTQDYVCSCVLRIARDMFALLPIDEIIINAMDNTVDAATGHPTVITILSVVIDRTTLDTLNFETLDPSDAMSNFKCNMRFLKTAGFKPVDKLGA